MEHYSRRMPADVNYVVWDDKLHLNSHLAPEKVSKILKHFGEEKILAVTSCGVHQGVRGKN